METSTLLFQLAILCALWRQSNEQNYLTRVDKCPLSKEKWEDTAEKANCLGIKTYHCVLSVQKNLYEGCMYPENITGWQCPQVRGINGDFDFEHVNFNCSSGDLCPKAGLKYRSDQLYKFPGCLGITQIETTTTTTTTRSTVNDQTYISSSIPGSNRNVSEPSTHGILIGVLFGIILVAVILAVVCYLRRTNRSCNMCMTGETRTPATGTKTVTNGDVSSTYTQVPLSDGELLPSQTAEERSGVAPDMSHQQERRINDGDRPDGTTLDVDYHSDESGERDAEPDTRSIGEPSAPNGPGTTIIQKVTHKHYHAPVTKTQISVEAVNVGNLQAGDGTNVIQHQTEHADANEAATNTDRDDQ